MTAEQKIIKNKLGLLWLIPANSGDTILIFASLSDHGVPGIFDFFPSSRRRHVRERPSRKAQNRRPVVRSQ